MNSKMLRLDNLIEAFRLSCRVEGKSPKTVEWYLDFLNRFYRFMELRGDPLELCHIERGHIRQFILHLQTEAINPHNNEALFLVSIALPQKLLRHIIERCLR